MNSRHDRLKRLRTEYEQLPESAKTVDRAQYEHDIWSLVTIIGKAANPDLCRNQRLWFSNHYHGSSQAYEVRASIFRRGWAHVLFDKLDNGLKYNAARTCLSKAKELIAAKVPAEKAMAAVIEAFDGTAGSIESLTAQTASFNGDSPIGKSKSLKSKVLDLAAQFAESATEGYDVEAVFKQQALAEFEASLSRVVLDFMSDISKRKSEAKRMGLEKIGSTRFRQACEVIGLAAKFGARLDMRRVTKAYRGRAAHLQRLADTAAGAGDKARGAAASDELVKVNQAYELLRMYVKQRDLGEHNGKS